MESAVRAVHIGLWRGPDLGAEVQKGHTSSGVLKESVLQHAPHIPWASNTHHGFRRAPWPLIQNAKNSKFSKGG